jgi:hypothetical protein
VLHKQKNNIFGDVPTLAFEVKAHSPSDAPWIEWAIDAVTGVEVGDIVDVTQEN